MTQTPLQQKFFLLLLVLISIAFVAVLLPFYGAVFWGAILALLFAPLNRFFLRHLPGRRNISALISLSLILLLVILPVVVIAMALIDQAAGVYERIQSGDLNFGRNLSDIIQLLPDWVRQQLEQLGLLDLGAIQERLTRSASQIGQYVARQGINIGQTTLHIVVSFGIMLYLLFFLLRDGAWLARAISHAIPLGREQKRALLSKFATVIRATVKGNIAVAATQGFLGGVIFWILGIQGALLWGTLMAFLSLLPAVGAGLLWLPVALYFLATGNVWQGVILIAFGIFVIGLVDNILRPLLVGKDTKMPDYVVLISTVGGLSLVGVNGFVIGPLIAAMFIATWDLFSTRTADPPGAWDPALDGHGAATTPPALVDEDREPRLERARREAEQEAQAARKEAAQTATEVEIAQDVAQKAVENVEAAEKAAEVAANRAEKEAGKAAARADQKTAGPHLDPGAAQG
jgi:predicted PurR-regulated permease PerM